MKLKTIRKIEKFINALISGKFSSVSDFCSKREINRGTFQGWISALAKDDGEYQDLSKELLSKYRNFLHRNVDYDEDEPETINDLEFEGEEPETIETIADDILEEGENAETEVIRDDDGKVKGYRFRIYRKNKAPLIGILDREEMNLVHRLYTYYGSNLTQRQVSRHFDYSLADFKRILSAFQIYKASGPFAPHMYEEHSIEELKDIQSIQKENDFLKMIEKDEIKDLKALNVKLAKTISDLKNKKEILKELVGTEDFDSIPRKKLYKTDSAKDLIIWLSDIHIGAYNDAYGFYELPTYDYTDIMERLTKVVTNFTDKEYNRVVIVNLGDSLDSYKKETTRGGHPLPSVTNDKENSKMFMNCMLEFFHMIMDNITYNGLEYYCIGEANHDGTWGWINNVALGHLLVQMDIKVHISDFPIDSFRVQDCNFIYCHGKDDNNQFKQFPLVLNDKTELYFNNWINAHTTTPAYYNYVVKGDLHRFAYTSGHTFDYVSVGSLYASSNYITANFGNTSWSINYFEVENNNVLIGKIS